MKIFLLLFLPCLVFASGPNDPVCKQLLAKRIQQAPKIDGILDEPVWQQSLVASHFIQHDPFPGLPESFETEVRVTYMDKGVFIAATLFDPHPDSIFHEVTTRDNVGNSDWFGIIIDAYNDGINALSFQVTASGAQIDKKIFAKQGGNSFTDGEDINWNAVWKSATHKDNKGWYVEMEIPFSAVRFPKTDIQHWHINFTRHLRRYRETSSWNEIKPDGAGDVQQCGMLEGIENIKSPVRLSATPFLAFLTQDDFKPDENPSNHWSRNFSGGMDVKYGINDAFTLDMTLVPDFSQVKSDNQVLNLTPYEIRFDENRQFFTEGLEIFNKGKLFYTRRIGGTPIHFDDVSSQLKEGEVITSNPASTQLYNATKISGRLKSGLGLGFFNATAAPSYAIFQQKTGEQRSVQTSPLTNYNVMAIDQSLAHNSSITLINANTWRNGNDIDANVTGLYYELRDKPNRFAVQGQGVISKRYSSSENENGHAWNLNLKKISGNWRWNAGYNEESDHYNPRDLGYLYSANERTFTGTLTHQTFKPFWRINHSELSLNVLHSRLFKPIVFNQFNFGINSFVFSRNFNAFFINALWSPVKSNDYFEPRTGDFSRYYALPAYQGYHFFFSPDYRKKLAIDAGIDFTKYNETGRYKAAISVAPRIRINSHFFMILNTAHNWLQNDVGYVSANSSSQGYSTLPSNSITFSRRNQSTWDNGIQATYTLSPNMLFSLRLRHYWTRLEYKKYFLLQQDGSLGETSYTGFNDQGESLHNTSFSLSNVDFVYNWRFMPGSDLYIVWKNVINGNSSDITKTYLHDLSKLPDNPMTNQFSIKIVFYLDYLQFRK